jgi:hypothetical protein
MTKRSCGRQQTYKMQGERINGGHRNRPCMQGHLRIRKNSDLLVVKPGLMHTVWNFVKQKTHHNKRRVSNSSRTSDDGCLTDITRSHAYPRRKSMTECLEVCGRSKSTPCRGQAKIPAMIDLPKSFTFHFSEDSYRNIEVHRA